MRLLLRYLLLALLLAVVALVSALSAMRWAIHGQEVTVPDLTNQLPEEAQRLAQEQGLRLLLERTFYSTAVPSGRVLSQSPPPGSLVRRGWTVRAALSLGARHIVVPDVRGQSLRAAEINLTRRGLEVESIATAVMQGTPADLVLAQVPQPGEIDVSSLGVSLLVAAPPPAEYLVMPDLIGRHLAEASTAIERAGLRLGDVQQPSGGSASSRILRQWPAPGERVTPGTVVNFQLED